MGVIFSVRGDKYDAYYSNGGASPGHLRTSYYYPDPIVDANAIGGSALDGGDFYSNRGLVYPGFKNAPSGLKCSMLMRLRSVDLWNIGSQAVMFLGNPISNGFNSRELWADSSGNLKLYSKNDDSSTRVNNVSAAHGMTDGDAYYDILLTDTGDTETNGVKIWVNTTKVLETTATRVLSSEYLQQNVTAATIGVSRQSIAMYQRVNEFVIFDTIETPTSLGLGASRSAFIAVDEFDGTAGSGGGGSDLFLGPGYGF